MGRNLEEDLNNFYAAEKQYLNREVDLHRVLYLEGWKLKPMNILLKDVYRFERKGRIIDVQFNKGGQMAYEWKDDLGATGDSIGILRNENEADTQKRDNDALNKLRRYASILHSEKTLAFYRKYAQEKYIFEPYLKFERHFLRTEVSIFEIANEFGYKAHEASSGNIYYIRDRDNVSLAKDSKSGAYLWFNHTLKEGGDIVSFVSKEFNVKEETAIDLLRLYAVNNLNPVKLRTFVEQAGSIKSPMHSTSLVNRIKNQPHYWALYDGYSELHKKFGDTDTKFVHEFLLKHFDSPELNPEFQMIEKVVGRLQAVDLTKAALLQYGADSTDPDLIAKVSKDISTAGVTAPKDSVLKLISIIQAGMPALAIMTHSFSSYNLSTENPTLSEKQREGPAMKL